MVMTGWDRVYRQQGQVQVSVLPKVKIVAENLKSTGCLRVLDLACGTGRHALYLAKEGFVVHGSDISGFGLAIARREASAAGTEIEFVKHDMNVVPYSDGVFHAVLCIWSIGLGTTHDVQQRVQEIHRVLGRGGTVVTDFMSTADETWHRGRQIEENTFLGAMEGLPDVIEHYSTRDEVTALFSMFDRTIIAEVDHFYLDQTGQKHIIKALDVEATK
jgi:ubiquinone/menaquinone biosynthesis C-methylase UbiE